jgi:coenzyme F420-reducing hydrogenase beta subunit/O-antigen/teichoic acid export membrane protein
LTLLASILVARILGKEDYGQLGIIRSTVGMFGVFAGLGLGLTATKHVAEFRQSDPHRAGRIMALSAVVAAGTGLVAALVLLLFAPWLAEHTLAAPSLAGPLRVGALMLLLSAMNGAQTGALAGFEAFKMIAQVNLAVGLLSFPMLLVGASYGGLTGTVWALVLNLAFAWALNHLALRREATRNHVPFRIAGCTQEWSVLWSYSLPAALSSLLVTPVTWTVGAMLVNRPGGYGEMGVFSAALLFQGVLLFVGSTVDAPMLSLLSHEKATSEHRLARFNILSAWLIGVLLASPLMCFPGLASLAFGEEFAVTLSRTLPLVLLFTCVMLYRQGLARVLAANSLMWWSVASNATWGIVLLASAGILTRYGAVGLAAAYTLAYALNTLLFIPLYLYKGLVPSRSILSLEAGMIWGTVGTSALLGLSDCSVTLRAIAFSLELTVILLCSIRLGRADVGKEPCGSVGGERNIALNPPTAKTSVVNAVVEQGRCSGCGVCAGLCPSGALEMHTGLDGDLVCVMAGACKVTCGICTEICPFATSIHDPRPRNIALFGDSRDPPLHFHPSIGWYRGALAGYRQDSAQRAAAASGGLTTWCLERLLENGDVTRVAVVRLARNPRTSFFEFHAASSVEEVRQASGSVYHPVEISSVVREILRGDERWAIVGVPCLCAAIRNSSRLAAKVPYVLGLACGMYQNTFYTEMLLAQSGIQTAEASEIRYRGKSSGGLASDYRFRGTDARGQGKDIRYHKLPFFLGRHGYFRYQACNCCMDVFAETADACFMDAWLPEFVGDPKGTSLVLLRNKRLEELFHAPEAARELFLAEMPAERVVQSQQSQVRRKQVLIHHRHAPQGERIAPPHAAWQDRLDWWLQERTQRRSKAAWARYGRRYGRGVFWIAMLDLIAAQLLLVQGPSRLLSLSGRVARKAARWLS